MHRRALPPRESKNLKNSPSTTKAIAQRMDPARRWQPKPSRRPGPPLRRIRTGTLWPTGIGKNRKGAQGSRALKDRVRNRHARAAGRPSAAARVAATKDAGGVAAIDRNVRSVLLQHQPPRNRRRPVRRDNRRRAPRTISGWVLKANNRDFTPPQNKRSQRS